MEQGGDTPEEADREVDLLEQIPLLDHRESRHHTFNHAVGIDVLEIIDSVNMPSSIFDAVCMGVAYVQVWVERKFGCDSPSFHTRLEAFVCDWSRQTGWPRLVRYEQETHDRGVSSSILIEDGVMSKTCCTGNTGTNQQSGTTRWHVPRSDDDENHQGYARFR